MAQRLSNHVANFEPDNLINQNYPVADVFTIELMAGQGVVLRGTVMALDSNSNAYYVLGVPAEPEQDLNANCIISDDTDTGNEADGSLYAQAYRTGHFNRNALITADEYELTPEDEESLRKGGILLSDAV